MKNKTKSKLIIGIFLFFIFGIGILYVFMPKNDFSETEKRYLSNFPKLSIKTLVSGDFASDFEEFLADQMPFRNAFVSINSYFQLLKGDNGSNGVYLGADGWLIEKPFDRDNRFDLNISRIKRFADDCSAPCAIAAIPSKGYIYADKLPRNSLEYQDSEYLQRLRSECNNMKVIDLFAPMLAEKDKQLFYKTDHHWTSDGAYLAYLEICKAFGLESAAESEFSVETANGFYGTSYSTSLYTITKPDTVKLMRSKKNNGNAEVIINDGNDEKYDNMFFTDALETGDKYVVFLNGNHSLVKIKTGNEGGNLLIIKDSFAHCLAPFLAESYANIIMVDLRYYKKPISALISENNISQVLFVYGIENLAESADIILR